MFSCHTLGSDQANAAKQVQDFGNEASLSHELIAGAASYEAAKAYEKRCDDQGMSPLKLQIPNSFGCACMLKSP